MKKGPNRANEIYLRKASLPELEMLSGIAQKWMEPLSKMLIADAETIKNVIYFLPEENPTKLAIEKAALRGGVEALGNFVQRVRYAEKELERRLKSTT